MLRFSSRRKAGQGEAGSKSDGTGEVVMAEAGEEGTIVLVLPRVLYLKRFAREMRVGFKA